MLGRTASAIFWMYRYLERAENTARLLEAGHRMTMTRSEDMAVQEWRSVLATLGLQQAYEAKYSDFGGAQVCDFVLRAKDNSENVLSMIERARTNARAARSSITGEVWEAINEGWMTLSNLLKKPVSSGTLNQSLGAVRRVSTMVRGTTHGSMLRNEAYSFSRLGTFIERADKTARILDVKYYLLLPSLSYVGTPLDTGQWDTVLRSLSAERAYRWLNAGRMDARSIADFLILDDRFPRSLVFCYSELRDTMADLAKFHGSEAEAHEHMRQFDMRLRDTSVENIFDRGLHEFLLDFIANNQLLASAIGSDYRFNS
ncbi:alpha-E domain-containing protein [Aurantiacibacter sediminis]|uniref:Alpha-E domain-containing protein n=1 Tax=Aurantiacibacter sediminis TaxID=2793064 RepID=A0ABS0N254_9SPHN|nr:alpha-E domain-containing protein [Aurantiacibacter sediminis]MBH5322044.1 alpha-E domain-containing protein [Aurantiacibacter sediminis]